MSYQLLSPKCMLSSSPEASFLFLNTLCCPLPLGNLLLSQHLDAHTGILLSYVNSFPCVVTMPALCPPFFPSQHCLLVKPAFLHTLECKLQEGRAFVCLFNVISSIS